ncbi:hypothetical protein [Burkholderia pseudomultivorans]|uniref:hypothetical protein n=1 Tax=Burkholderia pseudomultivorans TaxID=1207504 RepID=UPI0007526913|nr:hypothetical protein [Burkholderia pseudomultivorans]KWF09533.1 hypothetical protein WT55_16530 [Burkholderia pseudomultivorans]
MTHAPMPQRLTAVGTLERPLHAHLPQNASCFFWGEYTPYEHTGGQNWDFSATNQLISNLKKKMDRQGQYDWRYKTGAIQQVAAAFAQFWQWGSLNAQYRVCLVPVPPSKARTDPMYDPRMMDILRGIEQRSGIALDIRDCLSFSGANTASHLQQVRPTPEDLYQDLVFDSTIGRPAHQPGVIFLFDDMLTTGAHYVAASRKLGEYFPNVQVVGNFVARRIIPSPFADLQT